MKYQECYKKIKKSKVNGFKNYVSLTFKTTEKMKQCRDYFYSRLLPDGVRVYEAKNKRVLIRMEVNSKAEADRYIEVIENELANFRWQNQNLYYDMVAEVFGN